MISRDQAIDVLNKIRSTKPTKFFNKIDETTVGMKCILAYLNENKSDVYASTIAEKMHISRARVAVLIQKLLSKGLITKTSSTLDRRIEVINITGQGIEEANKFIEQILLTVSNVVDNIGIDELYKFIDTSAKIKNILSELE